MNTAHNIVDFAQPEQQTEKDPFVVILATGIEDAGKRAILAYSAAVTSAGMDIPTQLFLVGDSAHWAYEGNTDDVEHAGFPSLPELIEAFEEMGGETCLCSTCDKVCALPETGSGQNIRMPGVYPVGMAAILGNIATGSSVTF